MTMFLLCIVQVVHGDVIGYRQHVDKIAEQQQSKYLDLYTILPSEISMQLAEVSLALGAIEDQVPDYLVLAISHWASFLNTD